MLGTVVIAKAHTPYDEQICEYPHINLRSTHPWDPTKSFSEMLFIIGGVGWRGAICEQCG